MTLWYTNNSPFTIYTTFTPQSVWHAVTKIEQRERHVLRICTPRVSVRARVRVRGLELGLGLGLELGLGLGVGLGERQIFP